MTDGAQLGIGAEAAMKAVLGGDTPDEQMSVLVMRDRILAASAETATDYDGAANYAAKLILEYLLADPRRASIPTENVYKHDADGHATFNSTGGLTLVTPGLYGVMKEDGVPIDDLGLSGFQWGWAVNAARRCVELPAVPNPAIITIGGQS